MPLWMGGAYAAGIIYLKLFVSLLWRVERLGELSHTGRPQLAVGIIVE